MSTANWTTRRLRQEDRDVWRRLFAEYCAFYEVEASEQHLDTVWDWIQQGEVDALLAVPASGAGDPVGLAHLRAYVRPVRGIVGGYLDDLFVEPAARGTGAVEALFDAIGELAAERGWSSVRWMTAEDNYRARSVYDRIAQRTAWITYEIQRGG